MQASTASYRDTIASALLSISAREVSGFNQPKPPTRTIVIVVDISKAFETISHRHSSIWSTATDYATTWSDGLWRNSVKGRHYASTKSTTHFPVRCGLVASGVRHLPALSNHFVADCPIPGLDMTSYANDFTLEAEARANELCSLLVRWADGKQLAIAPQRSSVTQFSFDTHQSWLHPQLRIGYALTPL